MRKTGPGSMSSPAHGFSLDRVDRDTLRYKSATRCLDVPVTIGNGLIVDLTQAVKREDQTGSKFTSAEIAQIQQHIQQGLEFMWVRCNIR